MNLIGKFTSWTKTVLGKTITFTAALAAIFTTLDFVLKWGWYDRLFSFISGKALPFLGQSISLKVYILIFLAVCTFVFIAQLTATAFRKKEYYIPVKDRFYNGSEPSEYSRRTKWNFKGNSNFYFIPLLSHGYNSVDFVDLCGPYCTNCNHLLHLEGSREDLGHTFTCVNCDRSYKIPKELRGEYEKKIMSYFKEEYRQGRLREAR